MITPTKAPAQYMLASYIPDMRRMEPRNVGVVVWTRGACACRFLPEDEAPFPADQKNFGRWTEFWKNACENGVMTRSGKTTADSPDFVQSLLETQRGNFVLSPAGELLEPIAWDDLDEVATQLFDELVASPSSRAKKRSPEEANAGLMSVRTACRDIFSNLSVWPHPEMKRDCPVQCKVGNAFQEFRFDYRWSQNTKRYVQAVNIADATKVNATAFMFEWAAKSKSQDFENSQFAAAINAADDSIDPTVLDRNRDMLAGFCEVIDVADTERATASFRSLLMLQA